MKFLREYFRQIRREPSRLIPLALVSAVAAIGWFVREWLSTTIVEHMQIWLAARSKLAMSALYFIGDHWWFIPWTLVPLVFAGTLLWIGFVTRRFIQERFISIENLTEQSLHERARNWILARAKKEKKLGIDRLYLFSSVIEYNYGTSDVDLLVIYRPMPIKDITRLARHLKENTATDFKRTFSHRLHLSCICASNEEALNNFFLKADKHELLD